VVRIAAAGDVHASEATRERIEESFARVQEEADLVLLAGDLTTHGEPEQAAVLADACRGLSIPVCAILGNHDLHEGRADEVAAILRDAGVNMLERAAAFYELGGTEVGVVGAKGFVGGFGPQWANFGEPLVRQAYADTTADVEALDAALRAISGATVRVALLHYAPTAETLQGEPKELWLVLGADRLATPIAAHRPDLVLHGHAHAGSPHGAIDGVPVHNVAVQVTGKSFAVFTLPA